LGRIEPEAIIQIPRQATFRLSQPTKKELPNIFDFVVGVQTVNVLFH
jgi:hypothetical protein